METLCIQPKSIESQKLKIILDQSSIKLLEEVQIINLTLVVSVKTKTLDQILINQKQF